MEQIEYLNLVIILMLQIIQDTKFDRVEMGLLISVFCSKEVDIYSEKMTMKLEKTDK